MWKPRSILLHLQSQKHLFIFPSRFVLGRSRKSSGLFTLGSLKVTINLHYHYNRWKHAALCHQGSRIVGEKTVYIEDDVFKAATQQKES